MAIKGDVNLSRDLIIGGRIIVSPGAIAVISTDLTLDPLSATYSRFDIQGQRRTITLPDPSSCISGQEIEIEIIATSLYSALINLTNTTMTDVFEIRPNTICSFRFNGTQWVLRNAGGLGVVASYIESLPNGAPKIFSALDFNGNRVSSIIINCIAKRASDVEVRIGMFNVSLIWDETTSAWELFKTNINSPTGHYSDWDFTISTMAGGTSEVTCTTELMGGVYKPEQSYLNYCYVTFFM